MESTFTTNDKIRWKYPGGLRGRATIRTVREETREVLDFVDNDGKFRTILISAITHRNQERR